MRKPIGFSNKMNPEYWRKNHVLQCIIAGQIIKSMEAMSPLDTQR